MRFKVFLNWLLVLAVVVGSAVGVVYTVIENKIRENPIIVSVKDKVYDGTPIEITASATSGTPIVKYKLASEDDSTLSEVAPTNAGEYEVVARVDKHARFKDSVVRIPFAINPIELTLNWFAPENLEYDGLPKIPTLEIAGMINEDECEVEVFPTEENNNVNAGEFTFTAAAPSNSNYALPAENVSPKYTITKANYDMSNARWNYVKAFDYDGEEKSVEIVGLPEGVTVKSYTNNVKTNVGKYVATAKLQYDSVNYNTPSIGVLSWHISSKNLIVEIVQLTANVLGDKLSDVVVMCNDSTATLQWINGSQVLNSESGIYQLRYISADGERNEIINVVVKTLPLVDSCVLDDMCFTLNHTSNTAAVRANTDQITKAIIPEKVFCNNRYYSVTEIAAYGFQNMDKLTEVYIPKTITRFGSVPFGDCDNLVKARFADSLTKLGVQMFMYCYALSDVVLPSQLLEIPTGIFNQCSSLTSITIPSKITKIGSSAFYGNSLTAVTLPSTLTYIDNYAFFGSKITSLSVPSKVTYIGTKAFAQNSLLSELRLLGTTLELDKACFTNCPKLREIYINSATLVNSITTNTKDTSYLLGNLANSDILYIKSTITNITSPYILESFKKVSSSVSGYSAYKLEKYTIRSVSNASKRIYLKNAGLYGDETVDVITPAGAKQSVALELSMLEGFDTSTTGRKIAEVTYKKETYTYEYYVLSSSNDTSYDCISEISGIPQTYVVGESLSLSNATLKYTYSNNGYMSTQTISITSAMVSNFNTSSTGNKTMTITYKTDSINCSYNVKAAFNEKVTSASFENGKYYSVFTIEETTHFIIKITKGSYLPSNYQEMIEEVYAAQEAVSGLKHASKVTIDVDDTNYPSCGKTTLYLPSYALYLRVSSTFNHELAHALDHAQGTKSLSNSVLTEGFASYIEYLTAKKLFKDNPEVYSYGDSYNSIIHSYFNKDAALYDFEDVLLKLDRDEIKPNSQYEIGARVFSYLHHRYDDFCGWMVGDTYRPSSIDSWIGLMKDYYNNDNLFSEIHSYVQSFGDMYYSYLGADDLIKETMSYSDLTYLNKYNYYLDFSLKRDMWGYQSLYYKDLYVSIDSVRDQLNKCGIDYTSITLRTIANVTIELYNASGTKIKTVTNTTTAFDLSGVSFIKLVGVNYTTMYLSV